IETDADSVERDLFRLVLTLVELIRQLMERQAIRRVEEGDLDDEQVEALGLALMHLEQAMAELRGRYGLSVADLNIDLGPLGQLLAERAGPVQPSAGGVPAVLAAGGEAHVGSEVARSPTRSGAAGLLAASAVLPGRSRAP